MRTAQKWPRPGAMQSSGSYGGMGATLRQKTVEAEIGSRRRASPPHRTFPGGEQGAAMRHDLGFEDGDGDLGTFC